MKDDQVLSDRYELGEVLGRGGMSTVHRAHDRRLGRDVAVKLLRTDLLIDDAARERLRREARAVASLHSPHVVAVFDVAVDSDPAYLVMELVDGETLASRLARTGALPVDEALTVTDQLLAGLAAAHAAGIVHRDVKPGNVLLPAAGGLKLADFGIAKALDTQTAGLTMAGQVLGTPSYLSPEQAAGEPATAATDVYATGVLLFEMLHGRPPFHGREPIAVALAHQREVPPPLTELRPDVPPAVAGVVARALEKDPARRFIDAAAMRSALASPDATTVLAPAGDTMVLPAAAAVGAGGTRTMPAARRPQPPAARVGPQRALAAAIAVIVVVGLLIALALAASEDDDTGEVGETSDEPVPADEQAPTTEPPTTSEDTPPETTAPPPTDPPLVSIPTIGALATALRADPDRYGEKAGELADKLAELDEKEQPKKAQELLEKLDEWEEKGEIDPAVASRTRELVAPYAMGEEDEGEGDD